MPVIECVPNVSEGRDRAVIAQLTSAVQSSGAALLDVHSDVDHNRSVFTLAGQADVVQQAAQGLAAAAVALIDLRQQVGVHPRMGALDVVPFVPLSSGTGDSCQSAAAGLARYAADVLHVPVYFYEQAAATSTRPLERVRRGGFEGLAARMLADGGRPDLGPSTPHPSAGAIAIGVRDLLIAFNVALATDRLDVAQAIARAIRERDGGLPRVKALGLRLPSRGVVQVSMNLVDYRVTPPAVAVERIAAEASRLGVGLGDGELVGLIPEAALPADPRRDLRWPAFDERCILERALARHGLHL